MNYSKKTDIALWILQAFLALFFALASGAPKLFLPQDMLGMWMPLPNVFVGFIGVAEILGALGLILPGLTRIRPGLTPLAASGLVIVALVAYGRWRLAPLRARSGAGDSAKDLLKLTEREHHEEQEEAQPAGDDHAHLIVHTGTSSSDHSLATRP